MKAVKKIKKYVIKEYNKKEQEETNYKYGIFLIEDDYEPQTEADNVQELIDWVD
ncbi:hypothetical protein [Clostridium sp. M14]|uniref:hypothetical protein n=1 Tax=Clostridium sp. M14 TaxID=2716311 RepID=UPI0013EE8EA4|nr:hypothetical protein [Clostridium sp. M14]MBZ9693372.1 hypothetical protein [Clostridium sp. M14]